MPWSLTYFDQFNFLDIIKFDPSIYTLKKLFHYAIFQKFFHISNIHLLSMFYNTYHYMFMPFCFYKHTIRQ